ncbi:hypothetical protein [Campylobacter lanienae]|uniref:Uncharacterized protein n=1 Tax=Campylobacter lanienae NCTC 13004 TaxID=1031753 RepID=A0A1X9SND8_9BACT|nr:hypothetical protein [Campylobacter lanienae]ARQ97756.1 hypothetical protein CLAN_1019 [Campylobacter lanienae NCTC 13004]
MNESIIFNENFVFIAMVIVAIVLGIVGVIVVKSLKKEKKPQKAPPTQTNNDSNITLEDLIIIVSDKKSSKEEIAKAVLYFVKKFPFPPKTNGRVPSNAIAYLKFVSLVAGHKKSDAKLISYMTNELDKSNFDYISEIEQYKNIGLRSRM